MKNILILLFSFLLLAPPMQAHTDVVVYNEITDTHSEVENSHQKEQHKNDSDDEKGSEHHHHCNSISLVNIFLPVENQVNFSDFYELKEKIIYNETPNYFSYLDGIFQPPRNS